MKWDFCSKAKGDKKYVICNADEGDSGAFSDRYLLEDQPLKVIFGMVFVDWSLEVMKEYYILEENIQNLLKQLMDVSMNLKN